MYPYYHVVEIDNLICYQFVHIRWLGQTNNLLPSSFINIHTLHSETFVAWCLFLYAAFLEYLIHKLSNPQTTSSYTLASMTMSFPKINVNNNSSHNISKSSHFSQTPLTKSCPSWKLHLLNHMNLVSSCEKYIVFSSHWLLPPHQHLEQCLHYTSWDVFAKNNH